MASSKIYNVAYRLDEAKIYEETPFQAGSTTAVNTGDEAAAVSVNVEYVDEKSYSFNISSSTATADDGVPTTLVAAIPFNDGDSIEVGYEITISPFKWGKTTTTTTSGQASALIPVPPKSKATITYKGTKGKCDVPFSYTQRETSENSVVQADKTDGLFKGSNSYNFHFSVENVSPLDGN